MKESVGRNIGMLSNLIRREFCSQAFTGPFSGAQGRTLHYILVRRKEGDVFQKDIEEKYSLRPPTATHLLKEMEKNGLIRREPVPYDARLKRIVATEKALQYEGKVFSGLEALESRIQDGIPEAEMDIFFSVIHRMIENLS